MESVIKVWRVSDGVLVREVRGHFKEVHALDIAPDGRIVSGSKDKTIKIWTIEGKEIRTISVHSDEVMHVRVSRDSRRILSASKDKTAKLIDAATGAVIKSFGGHTEAVYSADISPDGKQFVTGSYDKTARVWDESGRNVFTFPHPDVVYSAVYSPDGRFIATGSEDRNVRLWDASSGRLLKTTKVSAAPTHIVFASNSTLIASEQVLSVPALAKTRDLTHAGAIALHPDGNTVALGSRNQIGGLYLASIGDPSKRKPLGRTANRVSHFSIARDGRVFTTLDAMRILDPRTGRLLTLQDGKEYYYLAQLNPDGNTIAVASYSESGSVHLYDSATGKLKHTLRGHPDRVTRMAFSKDGRMLATSDEKATIRIWEDGRSVSVIKVSGAEEVPGLSGHIGFPSLDFSPNGRMLVASWNDERKIVGVYDVSGRELAKIKWTTEMNEARFLDNDRIIVSGYWSHESAVFRLDGTQVGTLSGHAGAMTTVAVSPSGRKLVSTGLDKQILVWDAASFSVLRKAFPEPTDNDGPVFANDRIAAVLYEDYGVRFLDVETGRMLRYYTVGADDWMVIGENEFDCSQGALPHLKLRQGTSDLRDASFQSPQYNRGLLAAFLNLR